MLAMKKVNLLPLAITEVDDVEACVCGLNEKQEWIRLENVYVSDINKEEESKFRYGHVTEMYVTESTAEDRRIEDKHLLRNEGFAVLSSMDKAQLHEILKKNKDLSVEEGLSKNRSACLIKPAVLSICYGRTLGGKKNIRIIFKDEVGDEYNFIVVDREFKKFITEKLAANNTLDLKIAEDIRDMLNSSDTYFTITLTKAVKNYPGQYRGCHALIAGIHMV